MRPPPAAASAINPALFRNVRRLQVLSLMGLPFSPTDVMHRGEVPVSDHGMELHSTYLKASAPPTAVSRSRVIRAELFDVLCTECEVLSGAWRLLPLRVRRRRYGQRRCETDTRQSQKNLLHVACLPAKDDAERIKLTDGTRRRS